MYDDTIAAISTPVGESGIGIVRISGTLAVPILSRLFTSASGSPLTGDLETHRVHYGYVSDPESREQLDEVLALCMRAPRSYTREDVVEIHCHGGPVPVQRILLAALKSGARLAIPGEFTLRAFLNGRIDLAQAEAVSDVIASRTERSAALALKGLRGRLSKPVGEVRRKLLRVLAYLEATIDFSEDDIPPEDVAGPLRECLDTIDLLLANADQGIIARQGLRVAILGRPNAGKSSLLNALLRTDRAIVTAIPGTTRDTLEEVANFSGLPVCLIDTAGIGDSQDPIEMLGIERSRKAMAEADLCLLVLDGSVPLQEEDDRLAASVAGHPSLVTVSKVDLPRVVTAGDLATLLPSAPIVETSAETGWGIDALRDAIVQAAFSGQVPQGDELVVSNPRHKEALARARSHLVEAISSVDSALEADFTSTDVRLTVDALGEITGESATEDLLETIFSRFCVGK